jgi:putative flippase GtrA
MDSIMYRLREFVKILFKLSPSEDKFIQVARFIIAGGSTASLDFILYWFIVQVIGWHYILAVTISFVVASTVNYYLSIIWVFFNGKFKSLMSEYLVFLFFTALGLLLNYIILYVGIELLKINSLNARILSIVIVTIFNFVTKKFIVFKF